MHLRNATLPSTTRTQVSSNNIVVFCFRLRQCTMVRGYVYNANIDLGLCCWQLRMTNSRLVGGILTDRCCSVNWLTFICRTSHTESHYRSKLTGVDGSTGVWKAVQRLEINTVIKCHRLLAASTCSIACSKFDVKISTVKIFAVFIFVSRGFIRNIQKLALYENFPLYGI